MVVVQLHGVGHFIALQIDAVGPVLLPRTEDHQGVVAVHMQVQPRLDLIAVVDRPVQLMMMPVGVPGGLHFGIDADEVARYDLSGRPCSPSDKGIQIIVYSDFTAKTIIEQ